MSEEKSSGIKQVDPSPKEAKEVAKEYSEREIDLFEVRGGDPKMEYYWGNIKQDRLEKERWQRGFEVVNSQQKGVETMHRRPDGTHQCGDAILMSRPKELGEREQKRIQELSRARREGPKREFEEEGRRNKIRTFEEH